MSIRIGTSEPRSRSARATSKPDRSGSPTSSTIASIPGPAGELERSRARRGALDEVPLAAEQARDEIGEARVVLDQEQVHPPCVPAEHQRFLKARLSRL